MRGMPVVRVWAVVCRKQCYGKRVTNTASEVKWIKIVTDIFDDEKILLIEAMPEADGIIVIWFKILCLAGKINNCGLLTMSDRIAYTDEMLAHVFRRPLNTVRLALKTFEQFGMIEIINDTIVIPNWEKHQNVEKMVEIREYNRLAKQRSRERQRLNGLRGDLRDDCVNDMSMTCQPSSISVSNISSCSSHKEEKNKAGGEKGKVNENSEALRKKQEEIEARFEVFWNAYGYKKSRKDALRAFRRINPGDELLTKMLDSIEEYHKSRKWLDGYRMNGATWLNGECWNDEYDDESGVKNNQEHRRNHTGDSFKPRTAYDLKPQFVGHQYDADGNDITGKQD